MERGRNFKKNTGCRVLVNYESIILGQLFLSLRGTKIRAGEKSLLNCPKAQPARSNALSFVTIIGKIFRGVKKIFKKFFCLTKILRILSASARTTNKIGIAASPSAEKR